MHYKINSLVRAELDSETLANIKSAGLYFAIDNIRIIRSYESAQAAIEEILLKPYWHNRSAEAALWRINSLNKINPELLDIIINTAIRLN